MERNSTVTSFAYSEQIDVETAKEMAAVGIVGGDSFVGQRFSMGGQHFITTAEATADEFFTAVEASGIPDAKVFREAMASRPQSKYWKISTD